MPRAGAKEVDWEEPWCLVLEP